VGETKRALLIGVSNPNIKKINCTGNAIE
jgi:hypothetical protein